MDLSSTGLQNVDANEITADHVTMFSSLYVSGINIISSINTINSFIGTSNSSLNITGTTQINFNAGSTSLSYINVSGLNVFHPMNPDIFPYSDAGWYNVSECVNHNNGYWFRTQRKNCDNPQPFNGGMDCLGNNTQEILCPPGE